MKIKYLIILQTELFAYPLKQHSALPHTETLLPHCRFQSPGYLADTITRLLDGFVENGRRLPYYKKALLVMDEHCSCENRTVYDQDNTACPSRLLISSNSFCILMFQFLLSSVLNPPGWS